jgi:methylated-DNA-[protein]-cysteine S-methyltransferase
LTYKTIAVKLGNQGLARAVGNALNKNKDKNVSCHRVIQSSGKIGGFSGGKERNISLLRKEGVKI